MELQSDKLSPFFTLTLLVCSGICWLIFFGTFIELTQIGNRRDIIVITDQADGNMLDYKDVNRKILLEKERWAFYFLSFSFLRNNMHLLCKKRQR